MDILSHLNIFNFNLCRLFRVCISHTFLFFFNSLAKIVYEKNVKIRNKNLNLNELNYNFSINSSLFPLVVWSRHCNHPFIWYFVYDSTESYLYYRIASCFIYFQNNFCYWLLGSFGKKLDLHYASFMI